jgi:prepilin-type N-terminal cleavage/methylation domain-containing protein
MKKKGFTLIELLVVIAIIGILSSVVLASLNSARTKSRDARRISDLKQVQLALELSFDSNQEYPDALSTASLVTPGYIAAVPGDPSTGTVYSYDNLTSAGAACSVASGLCTDYCLGANLEDDSHSAIPSTLPCTLSGQDYTVAP